MTDKTYLTREFVSELIDKNQYIFVDDENQSYKYLFKPRLIKEDFFLSTIYWGDCEICRDDITNYEGYFLNEDIKILTQTEANKMLKEWGIVL